MEITYTKKGDYLYPDLYLPEQKKVGMWGRQHGKYLMEHKKLTYCSLLTSGKLNEYLVQTDTQAAEMYERLIKDFTESEGVTEQLKADDMLLWVQKMNNIAARAREIVYHDLIGV